MAAQAVDFTISGHVNRALVITDSDSGRTPSTVKDHGSSGSRIRVVGEGEMMDGGTAGVKLEYGAGSSLSLRYAEVWFSADYGKVSIGQGDQGGEGSVYNDKAGVYIGHGQESGGITSGSYYSSLDGGGSRIERIRYDTPSVGPFSVAVSAGRVGRIDQVSAGIKLSQDFGGTDFSAALGTIQWGGGDKSTVSGSAGVKLASGVTISGAWGKGKDFLGALDVGREAVPAESRPARFVVNLGADYNDDQDGVQNLNDELGRIQEAQEADGPKGLPAVPVLTADNLVDRFLDRDKDVDGEVIPRSGLNEAQRAQVLALLDETNCNYSQLGEGNTDVSVCENVINFGDIETKAAEPAIPDVQNITDPSFFQATLGYVFGDTAVGVSWYRSNDFQHKGSELTVLGVGVNHQLPKIGANVYATAQNFNLEDGDTDTDETVISIGTRIRF